MVFFCSVVVKQEPKDEDEDITENGQTMAEDDSKEAGELVCKNSCLKFSADFDLLNTLCNHQICKASFIHVEFTLD